MKLGKYLQIMKPTRTYKIECDGASSSFEPEDRIPTMLADAEVKRCFKDKETGCIVIEIEDGDRN